MSLVDPLGVSSGLRQFFTDSRGIIVRISIGGAGVALIIVGIVLIIASNKQVQGAVATVGKVAASKTPVGAAVTTAAEVAT